MGTSPGTQSSWLRAAAELCPPQGPLLPGRAAFPWQSRSPTPGTPWLKRSSSSRRGPALGTGEKLVCSAQRGHQPGQEAWEAWEAAASSHPSPEGVPGQKSPQQCSPAPAALPIAPAPHLVFHRCHVVPFLPPVNRVWIRPRAAQEVPLRGRAVLEARQEGCGLGSHSHGVLALGWARSPPRHRAPHGMGSL